MPGLALLEERVAPVVQGFPLVNSEITATGTLTVPDNRIITVNGTFLTGDNVYVTTGNITSAQLYRDGQRIVLLANAYNTYLNSATTTATSSVFWNDTRIITSSTVGNCATTIVGSYFNYLGGVAAAQGNSYKPKRPYLKKSVKGSIKRALKLMMNFGMEEEVRIFLSGETIEISHPESLYKFVITKYSGNLLRATEFPSYSTPYKLELYTKTNVHVANLCVYMKETPVLDQVLGVAMFIKTGCEEDILEKANFSALNSDIEFRRSLAGNDPVMQKKLRVEDVKVKSEFTFNRDILNQNPIHTNGVHV